MKMLTDKQTGKKWTNKRTELHQFRRNLAMMVIYLPVKFEFDWIKRFELESRNENVHGETDGRQTHQSNRRVGYTQPA